MIRKNTKKNKKNRKQLKVEKTVPEIRKSLDKIDQDVNKTLETDLSLEDKINYFIKLWKARIGKVISYKMAKDYVELRLRAKKSQSKTRRRQKGGMAPLNGASLDLTTRPGIYGYGMHGNFLPYVPNDLRGFWNSGISADCGKVNSTPTVPTDIGSNKISGGGLTTLIGAPLAAGFRFPMNTPPHVGNNLAAALNGGEIPGTTPEPSRSHIALSMPQQGIGYTNISPN